MDQLDLEHIRNFVIISHVDHGKSTLADRFLELTGTVEKRKMREQFLDMHPLEREKGITIKMQPVRMRYILDGTEYILNLIDTPGHADFSYEVSRALACVEGAILLVDASKGVEAQTLAALALAQEAGLVIIPVINKIDLPTREIAKTEEELFSLLTIPPGEILKVSAKFGTNVPELLRAVIERTPTPAAVSNRPLRSLIFDSRYDPYQGVIAHVRVVEGVIKQGERLRFLAKGSEGEATEVGVFVPEPSRREALLAGEIGYIATGIKEPAQVRVGDTITHAEFKHLNGLNVSEVESLPGYREPLPVVFALLFPDNEDRYEALRDALEKLKLNDSALSFAPEAETSWGRAAPPQRGEPRPPSGRGFRGGFLGMLHMEIALERLRREYGLAVLVSRPSVAFRVKIRGGGERVIYSAGALPDSREIESIEEPWTSVEILTPPGGIATLSQFIREREGMIVDTTNIGQDLVRLQVLEPLREIIVDYHDQLKSVSHGFASMAWSGVEWRSAEVTRLDILVAGEHIPELSEIVPREVCPRRARERVRKLKTLLRRELFAVPVQALVEGRVIARETIPALRKDVAGYLYGGDRTRKMKLWKKQERGKRKLAGRGRVRIAPEVFLEMART